MFSAFDSVAGSSYFLEAGVIHRVIVTERPCVTALKTEERGIPIRSYGTQANELPFDRGLANRHEVDEIRNLINRPNRMIGNVSARWFDPRWCAPVLDRSGHQHARVLIGGCVIVVARWRSLRALPVRTGRVVCVLSWRQIVPRQHRADIPQVDQGDLPVLRAFRHVRQSVGDATRRHHVQCGVLQGLRSPPDLPVDR
jgi:hypothetical protein